MYIYSSPCVYTYRGVQPIAPAAQQCLPDVHPSYGSPHWQVNSPLSARDSDHHSFSLPALAIDRDLTCKNWTYNTHEPLYVIRHIQGHTHTHTHLCSTCANTLIYTHISRHLPTSQDSSLSFFRRQQDKVLSPHTRDIVPLLHPHFSRSHKLLYVRISERQRRAIHQTHFTGPPWRETAKSSSK